MTGPGTIVRGSAASQNAAVGVYGAPGVLLVQSVVNANGSAVVGDPSMAFGLNVLYANGALNANEAILGTLADTARINGLLVDEFVGDARGMMVILGPEHQRRLMDGGWTKESVRDDLFERYVAGTDFIQQYIFPGGCLPSPSQFRAAAERAGLQVVDQFHFGPDYAQTLRVWRQQFLLQQDRVLKQGFDQRFLRTWEFYLAYCEAAFDEGNTDVVQFTLRQPD